jgi:signal transduction histidine kinase
MAPAVPFALVGVVQLAAVASWVGLAGVTLFPRLRRRATVLVVVGALAMAVAESVTALHFGEPSSDPTAWLRAGALVLLGLGAARGAGQSLVVQLPAAGAAVAGGTGVAGVVVPLGAGPTPALVGGVAGVVAGAAAWWRGTRSGADRMLGALLGAAFALTGVAAALAAPSRTSATCAVAALCVRAVATALLLAALVQLSRTMLLGKLVGAIVAGVVLMAAGAVGVVGPGVASEVQSQQSQRLLQVARAEQASLVSFATRAGLYADIVAQCPASAQQHVLCVQFLRLFSEQPDYFAVLVQRGKGATVVAPKPNAVAPAGLLQIVGSEVVRQALAANAPASTAATDVLLLSARPGAAPRLSLVAAVPVRPGGTSDTRVPPIYAAVYGIGVGDALLRSFPARSGFDLTVVADGRVLASSVRSGSGRAAVLSESRAAQVDSADPTSSTVVPAEGSAPTAAFVPITSSGNGDVRVATLAVSQPANEALAAQRNVLQRLFLTALVALLVVALLAIVLARRIAEPVRRLTVAAGRVRRGDLDASVTVSSRDEVGRLSRAFEAMTASLRGLTSDLRANAAEQAELRARMETVVSSMSDGLVVTDAAGVVTSANPTALELLGRDEPSVVGSRLVDVVRVEDEEGRSLLDDAMARRGTLDGQLTCAADERVPVRFGVEPLADGQGHVVVLADRRREHEVERMKTEFLANVSHELRTPLTPIRGYAEMIARRPELTRPQVEQFVDEILLSTTRMSRAVELLVDVAALEGGRVAPERSAVRVRGFVDDRVETWKQRYPERAGDFKRRVAGKLPAVDIDERWVQRALDELADNAVKYTPAKSAITVVASLTDDGSGRVRLALVDAGPGFDIESTGDLVADFAQADASETRRVGGLGLGLGFVSRVVERFGLELEVASTPGQGSEFALLLPPVR